MIIVVVAIVVTRVLTVVIAVVAIVVTGVLTVVVIAVVAIVVAGVLTVVVIAVVEIVVTEVLTVVVIVVVVAIVVTEVLTLVVIAVITIVVTGVNKIPAPLSTRAFSDLTRMSKYPLIYIIADFSSSFFSFQNSGSQLWLRCLVSGFFVSLFLFFYLFVLERALGLR